MKIVTAAQMMELDRQSIQEVGIPEKQLIYQAGQASARWVSEKYDSFSWKIWVVAGKGHNGADAMVAGRELRKRGYLVKIFKVWKKEAIKALLSGIQRLSHSKFRILLIDGIFGTGLNRPLKEPLFSMVKTLVASKLETISLDLPSGLHADSGKRLGTAMKADYTLTFGLPKLGLVQECAANEVGNLRVLDIGFPTQLIKEIQTPFQLITPQDVAFMFRPRLKTTHKGNLGHVLIIGGSIGFAGAPVLAARAALRAGAGLVSLLVPKTIYSMVVSLAGPEIMVHPIDDSGRGCFNRKTFSKIKSFLSLSTAAVLGPGMGQNIETRYFVEDFVQLSPVQMVLDADGLNVIAYRPSILRKAKQDVIVTPHPGEMGRLTSLTVKEVQQNRFEIAGAFAKEEKVTVVLKGARTIIAHPRLFHPSNPARENMQTVGVRFSVNALAGNPGMATAGCGDALSGIIGSLIARSLSPAEAAVGGVYLHARAGDLALQETGGGITSDLIEALPQAVASFWEKEDRDLPLRVKKSKKMGYC